jgi:thiol-disulfide isomerase/thioredoxin
MVSKMDSFLSNPLVMVLGMIIILIIILSIFRSVAPALTMGVGVDAHIGSLRGSLELEAYKNSMRENFQSYGDVNMNALENDMYGDSDSDSGSDSDDEDNLAEFVMFYADWCGHCQRAKPHFEQAMQKYKGPIKLKMMNAEDPSNKEIIEKQQIKGFPTIRYYPTGMNEGNYEDYEHERSYEGFANYLGEKSSIVEGFKKAVVGGTRGGRAR